ncbi:hypothetical protein BHE74_00052062 [Ensete ventricosum]|nr:hypothetical protein BHE74_00052062 [Ensete ventricosum]
MDVQSLFQSQSAVALQKAASFREVNLLNPILVHCRSSGKPFYAIMHCIDVGLVIDLEPVNPVDVPVMAAGAPKSYKLAAKAIFEVAVLAQREHLPPVIQELLNSEMQCTSKCGSLQGDTTDDDSKIIVNAPPLDDGKKIQWVDELHTITNEMVCLIETASVPIWAIDASGNINVWNSKAADLTGLPVQEATGVPLIDFVEDDSVEVAKKVLQLALRDEHILHIVFFMSFVYKVNFKQTKGSISIWPHAYLVAANDRKGREKY